VSDIPHCSCHRALRLRPETIERLKAAASSFGITVDDLGDRIITEMLPTVEREDLMAAAPEAS
jgi:hypothetical protein